MTTFHAPSFLSVCALGALGGYLGWLVGENSPDLDSYELLPLPHQVSKYADGISFRYAMVHDVLHERFTRHGKAYYRARNSEVRSRLAKEKGQEALLLMDDLGVGLDLLGRHDEAVAVMEEKLKRQGQAQTPETDKYTTLANLGTFLIHGNMAAARSGDAQAHARLRRGLDYLHQAITINKEAHFGREIWQTVAAEFFLAAGAKPEILLKYDLVGNSLEEPPRGARARAVTGRGAGQYPIMTCERVLAFLSGPWEAKAARGLRQNITRVGADPTWREQVKASLPESVPFDEPALGIIGMWRLGGGANPHFALALGEIMLRVGQRRLAWCAYERATLLADRFSPERTLQDALIAHCRKRQEELGFDEPERERLAQTFREELQFGESYQDAFQSFEAEQIAAGTSFDDPHFHDAFFARHGRIASSLGQADFLAVRSQASEWSLPLLGAGVFALLSSVAMWRFRARRTK
jgi:hypothetical protein